MKAFADGHQAEVVNIFAAHGDGQTFFFQPRAAAGFTGPQINVAGQIVAYCGGCGFPPAPLQLPDRAFKGTVGKVALARTVGIEFDRFRS